MSAEFAVQVAIRTRLVADALVTSLVPAASILDRNSRPAPDPSIILGEDQAVDDGDMKRKRQRVFSTIHVWKGETGLGGAKAIAGAIRAALHGARLVLEAPYHAVDCVVSSSRFMRDPDGKTAHGVLTVEILVDEVAP